MAIDGSFSLHFELERFLSRCPRISCLPEFDYLVKKVVLVRSLFSLISFGTTKNFKLLFLILCLEGFTWVFDAG